eukprot:3357332-Pyramimonas_sp.AAC.1
MPLLLRADAAELRKLGVLTEVAAELVGQEAVEMRVASDAADVAEALESVRRLLAADKRPAEGSDSLVAAKRPRQEAQEPPPAEEAQEAQEPPEDEEPAGVAEEPAEQPPLEEDPAEEAQVEAAAPAEGAAPVAGDGGDEDGGCAREYRQRFDYDIDVARELLQRIPQMLDLRRELEDRAGVHFLLSIPRP